MNYPEPIWLDETTSTNSYLAELCDPQNLSGTDQHLHCLSKCRTRTKRQQLGVGSRRQPAVQFRRLSGISGSPTSVPPFTNYGTGPARDTFSLYGRHPDQMAQRYLLERQETLRHPDRKRPDRHTYRTVHLRYRCESQSGTSSSVMPPILYHSFKSQVSGTTEE